MARKPLPSPPPLPPARELPTGDLQTDYDRIDRIATAGDAQAREDASDKNREVNAQIQRSPEGRASMDRIDEEYPPADAAPAPVTAHAKGGSVGWRKYGW
jgi:hypothetical protein